MISENKLKHSIGVARECQEIAKQMGKSEELVDACFVMGFLHYIGYELCDKDYSEHPSKSVALLDNFTHHKLDCLRGIKNHGTKYEGMSDLDYILNKADLTVDYDGSKVIMEERLSGIKERYGSDSKNYKDAENMSNAVKQYELNLNC